MSVITEIAQESNKNIRLNFEGGNLTSDAGLLLIKEFYNKFGIENLAKAIFHTTGPGHNRYQVKICFYFQPRRRHDRSCIFWHKKQQLFF